METRREKMIVLTFEGSVTLLRAEVIELQTRRQPTARVRVLRADLGGITDLHADVDIISVQGLAAEHLMRGTIYTITDIDGHAVELDIRSWPDLLDDVGTPGILIEAAPRPDVVWSILMTSGIDAESLAVEGKDGLSEEEFEVIVPVYGVRFGQLVEFGRVRLVPAPSGPPMAVPPEFSDLAERFASCDGLAITKVVARTMFEAEQQGLAEIDLALGVALLAHRDAGSDPKDPGNLPFSRERATSVIGRYPVVAVKGRWGRRWLRDTRTGRPEPQRLAAFATVPSSLGAYDYENVPVRYRQAIASWRRAVDETDRVASLMAMWESIEFYVSGTTVPHRFAKPEIRRIRERAVGDIDPTRADRVARAINQLNAPSLMERLDHAAASDGVLLTIGDRMIFQRLRDARNNIVHGHEWVIPAHADLRKGLSATSRLLRGALEGEAQTSSNNRTEEVRSDPMGDDNPGGGRRSTFTRDDKRWAEQATEAMMLVLPYIERRELVPGPAQVRIRDIWSDATDESLVMGHMRACDVAIKHLARHFCDGSLQEASEIVVRMLLALRADDAAGLGAVAYDDGVRGIRLMVDAMARHGPIAFPDLASAKLLLPAYNAVLLALLFELARQYGIAPARAAGQLGQEIGTINPAYD